MKKDTIAMAVFLVVGIAVNAILITNHANTLRPKQETTQTEKNESSAFSFVGVGDHLIHEPVYYYQTQPYHFDSIYEATKPAIQDADLAFINAETLMAGESFGLGGYPMFNGPKELVDALDRTGFDWLALSSNHTLDRGVDGLQAQLDDLATRFPHISVTGSHRTADEPYIVRDINGIRVGLLGYTYGLNGMELPEGEEYRVDRIDEAKIRHDMEQLSKISDVQLVSMHWGEEYNTQITEEQARYARLLHELGAEVVIGTHPHVIGPVEILKGEQQDTLVYYSLGNFLSAQDRPECMVGGMAAFDLRYDFATKKATFANVRLIPTITYVSSDLQTYSTHTIHDYDDALGERAKRNARHQSLRQRVCAVGRRPSGRGGSRARVKKQKHGMFQVDFSLTKARISRKLNICVKSNHMLFKYRVITQKAI